ncbi:MAG: FAD/NAD(P)-binding protein [Terriglobales bacterium]
MTYLDSLDCTLPHYSVVIVGGGFSGAVLAAHLVSQADDALPVMVVDRGPVRGRGVAYGTQCGGHLLNVPAGNMSAFHDQPDHFLRWAQAHYDRAVTAVRFLPRRVYGQYLEWVLAEAAEERPGRIVWKTDEVESVIRNGEAATMRLRSGKMLTADKVVLALGNFPPAASGLPETVRKSRAYIRNPWAQGALYGTENDDSILVVGSGLTGIDAVIGLRARGFKGVVHLLSRHGLLPQKHKPGRAWPAFWNADASRTARGLLRLVRQQVKAAGQHGSDWRAVIDSLRSFTPAIWQALPIEEKRRFLRHLRPYWEIHRHRIAPEIGCLLEQQLGSGEIETHAGRIVDCQEQEDKIEVIFRDRRTGEHLRFMVDRVLNCTGPETDCRKLNDPLVNDLLRQGLVRPDPLHVGLDVAEDGAVIDAQGVPSNLIYTVGPARKGRLWETTAVPEIRQQVADLASLLMAGRGRVEIRATETLFAAD